MHRSALSRDPKVSDDLLDIYLYIVGDDRQAAVKVVQAAEKTFELLQSIPEGGKLYPTGVPGLEKLRMMPIRGYSNYLVFYVPKNDEVRILYVYHGAQNILEHMSSDFRT